MMRLGIGGLSDSGRDRYNSSMEQSRQYTYRRIESGIGKLSPNHGALLAENCSGLAKYECRVHLESISDIQKRGSTIQLLVN